MDQTQEELLLEEYKILENRYRSDTNRIWSQAQILMAANVIAITVLSAVFSDVMDKTWHINPGLIVIGVALLGFAICVTWFLSLATDVAYQDVSRDLLRQMEVRLPLPMKVFSEANKREGNFAPWQKIGGEKALGCLSWVFIVAWIIVAGIGTWLYYKYNLQTCP